MPPCRASASGRGNCSPRRPARSALAAVILLVACSPLLARAATAPESQAPASELIQERWPDGRVKIEREVALDEAGNYVNHGAWRMWNAAGGLVGEGRHERGQRVGIWTRWHDASSAPVLSDEPFHQFTGPFVSQASFVGGRLHGEWTVTDANQKMCSRVTFDRGKRDGPATLYLPDGSVYREASFRRGVAVGEVLQRNAAGELAGVAVYCDGHQLVERVTYHPDTQIRQSESTHFAAMTVEVAADDFWALRFAEYESIAEDLRHGPWRAWHSNGQLQAAGNFHYDREAGTFTWWHANGQKAVEGGYVDGLQDGAWAWWHANGQRAAVGELRYGSEIGLWQAWTPAGQLVERKVLTADGVATAAAGRSAGVRVGGHTAAGMTAR